MRPATSRHELSPGRACLLTSTAIVVIGIVLATFGPDLAEGWPVPRYECYCQNCYVGYFICRNRDYSCNCEACSCYNDVHAAAEMPSARKKNGNNNNNKLN